MQGGGGGGFAHPQHPMQAPQGYPQGAPAAAAQPYAPPPGVNPAPASPAAGGFGPQRGFVKRWNFEKGYGFIQPYEGGDDVFVHHSVIHAEGFRSLLEGSDVEFEAMQPEPNRFRATKVCGPGGSLVQAAPRPPPQVIAGNGFPGGAAPYGMYPGPPPHGAVPPGAYGAPGYGPPPQAFPPGPYGAPPEQYAAYPPRGADPRYGHMNPMHNYP